MMGLKTQMSNAGTGRTRHGWLMKRGKWRREPVTSSGGGRKIWVGIRGIEGDLGGIRGRNWTGWTTWTPWTVWTERGVMAAAADPESVFILEKAVKATD
jgi:hypothetical protein